MTARPTSTAFASLALAVVFSASAFAAGAAITRPVRDVRTLPSLASVAREATPLNAIVSTSDTFLVRGYGFDDLTGICQDRGWVGEDRTSQIYAHVQSNLTVNEQFFLGLGPDTLVSDPFTGSAATTRLYGGSALAVTDSGAVVFSDEGGERPLFAAYPGPGVIRVYGRWSQYQSTLDAAFDPVEHRLITSTLDQPNPGLYAFSGNGSWPEYLGGYGPVTADTTLGAARLAPFGLAVDASGNIYFAEYNSNRVRMVRNDGRVVTIAGSGIPGFSGDGGPATAARLFKPYDVAIDESGTVLYITDSGNNRIRVVQLATGIISTLYGDGTLQTLPRPRYIALSGGALWITSYAQKVFRLQGGVLTTVVGGGDTYGPAAGIANPLQQMLGTPAGIAPDGADGVYFVDPGLELVFHLDAGGTLSAVAGVPVSIAMGNRSLWFGADMASAPDEVANWVKPSGYGNGWSQRLTSPEFSVAGHPGAVLSFDGSIDLQTADTLQSASRNAWVQVQAVNDSGVWSTLTTRLTRIAGSWPGDLHVAFVGRGRFKAEVHLNADNNQSFPWGTTTRLRLVVQTEASGSGEDGLAPDATDGALVVDNLTLRDGDLDLIPRTDFEDGTTGPWTLSALNGAYTPSGMTAWWFRDGAVPATGVALRKGFDFTDPTCVWTFLAAGDTVNHRGLYARLTSPWFATAPGDTQLLIAFSGKLNTVNSGRVVCCWVRGKRAGDTRPRFASPSFFSYNSGTYGDDAVSPYVNQRMLRYPADFESPLAADSVQIVLTAQDQTEIFDSVFFPPGITFQVDSKLPYLDDLRVYQLGVDRDHDGVSDALDLCPDSCAAGQDADGDGCVDLTATMRHVESWDRSALPLHYTISVAADPRITDGSDLQAIMNGFNAWTAVPGTSLRVVLDPYATQTNASAYDGVNLVTFQDDYVFPPNVIAITPTLSALRRTTYDDKIVLPGQIVDADMIFNPQVKFRTATYNPGPGSFDLQSVVTHEAGHVFGLSHSGVLNATMFFVLQPGQGAASLEGDDQAAIRAAYPGPTFATDFTTITGTVVRGGGSGEGGAGYGIPGALVTAVRLDNAGQPADSVASDYTDEGGNYALRGLAAGSYSVRVTPLDGEVGGYALTPDYISDRINAIAQTNFAAEWWCQPESDRDTPAERGILTLAAGEVRSGIDVITNVDTIPPAVVSVSPKADTTDVRIDTAILVNFSERIDKNSLQGNVRLHEATLGNALGLDGVLVNGGRGMVLTPTDPLHFGTLYQLDLTTGLTDRDGVHLASQYTTKFTTEDAPPVAIADIQPRAASPGSFVTILGTGFDPSGTDSVVFDYGSSPLPQSYFMVPAVSITPTSMMVRVPGYASSGSAYVEVNGTMSNPFSVVILPALAQTAPSYVTDVTLSFAPTDVALASAGDTAYAVGSGGLAVVDLQSRHVTEYSAIGQAQSLGLTPDGKRLVVTRPAAGDVATVDVSHGSGTFGQVLGTTVLPSGSAPQGVAITPTGRMACVTDPASRVLYKIDIDPLSATRFGVLDEVSDTTIVLNGGIASSPSGTMLFYGTSNAGVRRSPLPGHSCVFLDGTSCTGGVAVNPGANEVLFTRAGPLGAELLAVTVVNDSTYTPQVVALGGDPRDAAYNRDGNAAYVVNSLTNQLQMLDTNPADTTYRKKVAEVATGSMPVAVTVSGYGDVIAVANYGSRSLSLYRIGGTAALLRAVPGVARPGDVVALTGSGVPFGAGSQVDVGSGLFSPAWRAAGGNCAAFVLPPGPQRDAQVAAVDSLGMRTLGLPLTIVDPVSSLTAKSTGFAVGMDSAFCGLAGYIWGQMASMRLSPDGKWLAVARDLVPGDCGIWLETFQATDQGAGRMGSKSLSGVFVAPPGSAILGFEYTADGKNLWVSPDAGPINVVDTDPASLSYGTIVRTVTLPLTGTSSSISADPLSRCLVAGDRTRDSLAVFDVFGMFLFKVQTPGPTWATKFTPDGRYIVTAGAWRTGIVDFDARALL
ncbi:MAG TPA: Ig-like domain-containing protein, partial [Terriglobales bacterium]|nr:Ig-like domain-containing protein [Terriglobales bacterium]